MTARMENADVRSAGGLLLAASFGLRNASNSRWASADGFAAGYQIFDPQTGLLLIDGPRTALAGDVAPGAAQHCQIQIELPSEPGRYQIYVSGMREGSHWFYEQGGEFLLVDTVVQADHASVERVRVVKIGSLRRERMLRSARRAFTLPLETIVRNRSLIRAMVRRDVLARYRGSFGGIFWTVLNPLILMVTYFFVFSMVLHTQFPNDPSPGGFALYFLAGMLPWLAVSEALGRAPTVMLEHRNFVKKLMFPVETLPINLVIAGLVSEVFGLVLLLLATYVVRGYVPWSIVWLPLLLVPQILLTIGLCWFLAGLGVFVRDLAQINGFLLTLWFFLTPICYPETALPGPEVRVLVKNPMFILVRGYRTLLDGRGLEFQPYWKLCVFAVAIFILGHAWFHKLRKSFADII